MYTRGSGSTVGSPERPCLTDDDICKLIATKVYAVIQGAIPEVFGSIKTVMIKSFDERYAFVSETATTVATATIVDTGVQGRGLIQHQDISNTKPLEFHGVKDLIVAIRWIYDVEG